MLRPSSNRYIPLADKYEREIDRAEKRQRETIFAEQRARLTNKSPGVSGEEAILRLTAGLHPFTGCKLPPKSPLLAKKVRAELLQFVERPPKASRHGELWADDEIALLPSLFAQGLSIPEIATRLQRSPWAICRKAQQLGLIDDDKWEELRRTYEPKFQR